MTLHRQKSLLLSETAFHDAAVYATEHTGDDQNDDPNALHDTERMIEVARKWLEKVCPEFLAALDDDKDIKSSSDRLVKVGRNVSSTLRFARRRSSFGTTPNNHNEDENTAASSSPQVYSKAKIDASLSLLADECTTMATVLSGTESRRVPKVRFGSTELQMPVLTLGCMRFQQSWNRGDASKNVLSIDQVKEECQDNLIEILKYAIRMGVNHIETAQGYGSSELQMGFALKHLFESGFCKREDLIIQTKSAPSSSMTPDDFRNQILEQLDRLKLTYIDLFSIHGLNTDDTYKWLFDHEKGNLITAPQQLKAEGKLRHIGFSSHGTTDVIGRAIQTNAFEYVNLHYHFCGSYTASGDGKFGGNLENIRLAQERDMGVFIISAYDKGGRLYAPSHSLRELILPDFEPMAYGSLWLWQHHMHDEQKTPIHTIVCGAARPSDLDQPILATFLLDDKSAAEKRQRVSERLELQMEDVLGKDWVQTWYEGVPNWVDAKHGTQLNNIIWYYNIIRAFGMLDFAKERYAVNESNLSKLDYTKSKDENIAACGPVWGWMPGFGVTPKKDYTEDFKNCPPENQKRLNEAIEFVHKWCSSPPKEKEGEEEKKDGEKLQVPLEWETSYDMRPWTAFPERS